MDSLGIEGIAVCRRRKDFSIADVEDRGADKDRLERFNVCVNDVPEEETSSNLILLIQKLLIQESELHGKEILEDSC